MIVRKRVYIRDEFEFVYVECVVKFCVVFICSLIYWIS